MPGPVPASHMWVLTGSVGAIDALRIFLGLLPDTLPVAFVLSLHIADSGMPMLLNVLARSTRMRVSPARSNHIPRNGEILVAPVGHAVSFGPGGELEVAPLGPVEEIDAPAADAIMVAVARRFRACAGAVVFSGIGSDGAEGCREIVQYDGKVWVQDPESAPFSSMPGYIIDSCEVAYCASPEGMARRLIDELNDSKFGTAVP